MIKENQVRLVVPSIEHKEDALKYIEETKQVEDHVNGSGSLDRLGDFEKFLEREKETKNPETVPENWVHGETLYLVNDQEIIGMINLRYEMNDIIRRLYGHIGYSIRPKYRKQGYGKIQLKLVLDIYRNKGFKEVMISTDPENIASQKVITHFGGVLKETVEENSETFIKYWIKL